MPFDVYKLKTDFQVIDGYLAIRYTGPPEIAIAPLEAGEHLCYESRGRVTILKTLNDLVGKVRILSPGAALSYLRLCTSPLTFYLLREPPANSTKVEVINRRLLDVPIVFGNTKRLRSLRSTFDGDSGIVGPDFFAHHKIPTASSERNGDGFVCRRTIYEEIYENRRLSRSLYSIAQQVRLDGSVRVLDRQTLPTRILNSVHWLIPKFE